MAKVANDNKKEKFPEFVYQPIDQNKRYDRKTFADAFDDFSDLEDYNKKLVEDPRNVDTLADLGGLLLKNPSTYINADDPLLARHHANVFRSKSIEAMARYVKNNFETFLVEKCDDSALERYVMSVPLYKTTEGRGQNGHNEFVDSLNSYKNMAKIASEGKPEEIREYVAKKLENAPEWIQELLVGSLENPEFAKAMFGAFAQEDQKKFSNMLKGERGKINRSFMENVIRDSLKEAYHQLGKETNLKDAKDIWEQAIRPYYISLAAVVHPGEKKDEKMDRDVDRERRKNLRRKVLGMAA